jgi:Trypsin-like peptidase domain/Tetratricopeptide repeat
MKSPLFLGCTLTLICFANQAFAKTSEQIEEIAKAVTVEIRLNQAQTVGSGIIIKRQGSLYTIITNRHVVCGKGLCSTLPDSETYTLGFSRGERLNIPTQAVKLVRWNLDLAVIQFRSSRPLPIAQVASPGSLKVGGQVFTSGYPWQKPGFSFNSGTAIAVVNRRLHGDNGGYTIIYNAETQPGMSGGGVFDENGLLVAIHGRGDRYQENTEDIENDFTGQSAVGSKIGLNRGIPIRWVLESITAQDIQRSPISSQRSSSKADEHFVVGFNKWIDPGSDKRAGRQEAIQGFSQAIRLKPRYKMAYFMRGYAFEQIEQYVRALSDLNKFILLDPQSADVYHLRGRLKHLRLNDNQGAIADFEKAISINPGYSDGWYSRGFRLEYQLRNPFLKTYRIYDSIENCNRAITINPQDFNAYLDRGILKFTKLDDRVGGITDIRTVMQIAKEQDNSYLLKIALRALELMGSN